MALLGLDFGTSRTRAARWAAPDGLASQVVEVPSLVLIDETGFVVGESVAAEPAGHGISIHGLKRMLERSPNDLVARVVAGRSGATLHMPEDRLVLCTPSSECVFVDGCVAALLHQAAARTAAGEPDDERLVVLAVPEWFDAAQQSALGEAARRAGLRVLRFIGEGAAAALWAARQDDRERTVVYVDVGAGGLSVAVVAIDPQGVYLSAASGDRHWGGDELTATLVDNALEPVAGADADPAVRERVRLAVEAIKPALARRGEAATSVTVRDEPTPLRVTLEVTPGILTDALQGLLDTVEECCERALDEAEVDRDSLDAIYALGPTARMPAVAERIARALGKPPTLDERLDATITLGAAYEAAILGEEVSGPLVLDGQSTGRLSITAQ